MAKTKTVPKKTKRTARRGGLDLSTMRPFIEGLLLNMQGGVCVVDNQKRIQVFNKAAQWITGYCADEVLGKICGEVSRGSLCDRACCFDKIIKKGVSRCNTEAEYLTKDDHPIPVNITAFPLKDPEGNILGMVEIFRDISEVKALQTQLLQSERLAILGQLAAGVAHEINNPISGILTYINLLLKKLDQGSLSDQTSKFKEYLSIMERETKRVGRTTKNLLDFSRRDEPDIRPVQLNEVVEQSLMLLGDPLSVRNVEVTREGKAALPDVMGDFGQLQQVFVNLFMNAAQAMPKGGRLKIQTAAEGTPGRECFIKIAVSDTGCGIPKENIAKIFDPFFTTKGGKESTGLGLGLSIVQRIIKSHHGHISVRSTVGKGSTFTVELPTV
jgi:two-component system NtrC family sensor kinase